MLLPDNIQPEYSIYYNGYLILDILNKSQKLNLLDLYQLVKKYDMSYTTFLLSLDWLYLINATNITKNGEIELCLLKVY